MEPIISRHYFYDNSVIQLGEETPLVLKLFIEKLCCTSCEVLATIGLLGFKARYLIEVFL